MTVIARELVTRDDLVDKGFLTRQQQTALEKERGRSVAMKNAVLLDIERRYPQRYDRLLTVEAWERERKLRVIYGDYGTAGYTLPPNTVTVKIGDVAFHESIGQFPSEKLIVRLALAVHAGHHDDPLSAASSRALMLDHVWIEEVAPVEAAVYEALGQEMGRQREAIKKKRG